MKHYEEQNVVHLEKKLVRRTCDFCNQEINPNHSFNTITIVIKGYVEMIRDICDDCYKSKFSHLFRT